MQPRWLAILLMLGAGLCPPAIQADENENEDAGAADGVAIYATREAETAEILAQLASDDPGRRGPACRRLEHSGITVPAVFERAEAIVLHNIEQTITDGVMPREEPSCVRALATSGDPKYLPTMRRALDTRPERGAGYKFARRHIERSIAVLPEYPAWNALLQAPPPPAHASRPWSVQRALILLEQGDAVQRREGFKQLRLLARSDAALYAEFERLLRAELVRVDPDAGQLDLAARFVRALAESRDRRYQPAIEAAAAPGRPNKLRRHAQRALRELGSPLRR